MTPPPAMIQRLLRSGQQPGDGVDLLGVRHRPPDHPVTFGVRLRRPVVGVRLHILRKRQHHRAGVRGICEHPHGRRQRCQQRLGPTNPIEEPRHRPECIVHRRICLDGVLQLLQYRALPAGRVDVSRQQQDWEPVDRRQGSSGHQVHSSGADRRRHSQCRVPSRRLGIAGCHVYECLLIAALDERQRVAELIQCLAESGHIAVAEDPQRGRDQPGAVIRHRILPGQVRNEGLVQR